MTPASPDPAVALTGLGLVPGSGYGPALISDAPVGVARIDPHSGILLEPGHPLHGRCVAGCVLVFESGKGSSSGSYILLNLRANGKAPAAIVMRHADAVVTAGAVLAEIPLVGDIGTGAVARLLRGNRSVLHVDGGAGRVFRQ